jgi:hypothetical protein
MQPVGVPLVNPTDVNIDLQVSYLAGGGAGGLPVTLRTQIEPKQVTFADFDDYSLIDLAFNTQSGTLRHWHIGTGEQPLLSGAVRLMTDARRTARLRPHAAPIPADTRRPPAADDQERGQSEQPRDILAELEYRDPTAKRSRRRRVALWPATIVLGIKPDSWVATGALKFTVAAVDLSGKPVAGVACAPTRSSATTTRTGGAIGGFYAYEHGYDTARRRALHGVTDPHGLLICEMPPPPGISFCARSRDAEGRAVVTRRIRG